MLGVAAVGNVLCDPIAVVISLRVAFPTQLFLAFAALVAVLTRIDHASDCDRVPDLVTRDLAANLNHAADDLVAGNERIHAPPPVVARLMKVGVTDTAIEDFHCDVVRAQRPPFKGKGGERCVGGLCCIAKCFHIVSSIDWIEGLNKSLSDRSFLQLFGIASPLHRDL